MLSWGFVQHADAQNAAPRYARDFYDSGAIESAQAEQKKAFENKLYYKRENVRREIERTKTLSVGGYEITSADRNGFEKKIYELIRMANGNDERIDGTVDGVAKYNKLDMETRKKYFSPQGWEGYQQYVRQHRARLEKMGGHTGASGGFIPTSVQYLPAEQDRISFSVEGRMDYHNQDSFCGTGEPSTPFNLALTFLPLKPEAPVNFIIDKWELSLCSGRDLSCFYQGAKEYPIPHDTLPSVSSLQQGTRFTFDKGQSDTIISTINSLAHIVRENSLLPTSKGILVRQLFADRKPRFSQEAWGQYLQYAYSQIQKLDCEA